LEREGTWWQIGILLTCTLEESKEYDTRAQNMWSHEMIWIIGSPRIWTFDMIWSQSPRYWSQPSIRGRDLDRWSDMKNFRVSHFGSLDETHSRRLRYEKSWNTLVFGPWSYLVVTSKEEKWRI
jgi:hypothetical protein